MYYAQKEHMMRIFKTCIVQLSHRNVRLIYKMSVHRLAQFFPIASFTFIFYLISHNEALIIWASNIAFIFACVLNPFRVKLSAMNSLQTTENPIHPKTSTIIDAPDFTYSVKWVENMYAGLCNRRYIF